jgi:hypothetical protein
MPYTIDTEQHIVDMIRFAKGNGIRFNFQEPKTIQDKLAWLNIYDSNELKVKCADKIQLHEYCKERIGKDICVPIIATYKSVDDIKWESLPDSFVIKCNHGSGMEFIVPDKADADINLIEHKIRIWMNTNFAFRNGFEAHYNDIPRKILIEEYKEDGHDSLVDYKFWCFNGEPKFYSIGEQTNGSSMCYKMNGAKWDLFGSHNSGDYKKPKNLAEMKRISKILSEPFKFVRINFYEIDGKMYLGEMTFTPGACVLKCQKPEDDLKLGNMLKLE